MRLSVDTCKPCHISELVFFDWFDGPQVGAAKLDLPPNLPYLYVSFIIDWYDDEATSIYLLQPIVRSKFQLARRNVVQPINKSGDYKLYDGQALPQSQIARIAPLPSAPAFLAKGNLLFSPVLCQLTPLTNEEAEALLSLEYEDLKEFLRRKGLFPGRD